jgi:uncharacterized protein involved in exopolysaccharide biosynthesis
VEGHKTLAGEVQRVVTEDLAQRLATTQQKVLGGNRLQPLVERMQLVRRGETLEAVIERIRAGVQIEPVVTGLSQIANARGVKKGPGQGTSVPGFYVDYTASDPREAQSICYQLTSMLLSENQTLREQVTESTTDWISRQLDEAKHKRDAQDARLAAFKRQYAGHLSGDGENNLKVLGTLNSELDANTQIVDRAQQDRAYTESLLTRQLASWTSSQGASNPQTLELELTQLQGQLLSLEARYTDDHPDVIKTKADIAEVKSKLGEVNAAAAKARDTKEKASLSEPAEIRRLRLQIHQDEEMLAQATREQKRLTDQIRLYQGRVAISPEGEETYRQLTRDYDTAQKFYADLLAKKSTSQMAEDGERRQQGEQMRLLNPADLPDSPSFPNRLLFAGGGLGAGLVMGLSLARWLEMRDKWIRTEADVEASLQAPVLVLLLWVTESENNGSCKFLSRQKEGAKPAREKAGV